MPDAEDPGGGPDLFRSEALAHRYRKHWGRVSASSRAGVAEWLMLGAGVTVAGGAFVMLARAVGWTEFFS